MNSFENKSVKCEFLDKKGNVIKTYERRNNISASLLFNLAGHNLGKETAPVLTRSGIYFDEAPPNVNGVITDADVFDLREVDGPSMTIEDTLFENGVLVDRIYTFDLSQIEDGSLFKRIVFGRNVAPLFEPVELSVHAWVDIDTEIRKTLDMNTLRIKRQDIMTTNEIPIEYRQIIRNQLEIFEGSGFGRAFFPLVVGQPFNDDRTFLTLKKVFLCSDEGGQVVIDEIDDFTIDGRDINPEIINSIGNDTVFWTLRGFPKYNDFGGLYPSPNLFPDKGLNIFKKNGLSTDKNDTDFWKNITQQSFRSANPLNSGWINIVNNEVVEDFTRFVSFETQKEASRELKENQQYTIFWEVRNKEGYVKTQTSNTTVRFNIGSISGNTFSGSPWDDGNNVIEGLNKYEEGVIYRKVATTLSDLSEQNSFLSPSVSIIEGIGEFSFDVRMWVVEGDVETLTYEEARALYPRKPTPKSVRFLYELPGTNVDNIFQTTYLKIKQVNKFDKEIEIEFKTTAVGANLDLEPAG